MKIKLVIAAFLLTGCVNQAYVSSYTNDKAVDQMESFIRAHAALQNTTPGPMKTNCELLEKLLPQEENEYACVTLISDQNLILEADCNKDIGCSATGYKLRDPQTGALTEGDKP